MTAKRYHKLLYALMQKIHQEDPLKNHVKWGSVLRAVGLSTPIEPPGKHNSYAEAWESLRTIREEYGM